MIGTRFEATHEAMLSAAQAKAIVAARGDDTSRNRVFDIARRSPWPTKYTARMLRNPFFDRWQDREDVLRADTAAQDVLPRRRAARRPGRDPGVGRRGRRPDHCDRTGRRRTDQDRRRSRHRLGRRDGTSTTPEPPP
ncbi:hypothetical protein [Nocardia brasiliensis]|uniref:hypothetical protein n=1 Tax=Nocardia brasiliensis TaxID=37326 RepID=UPI0033C63E11